MITVKNTQRTVACDATSIGVQVQTLLNTLRYTDFAVGIWITTNRTIRFYNRMYRYKDKPTDILSFPYHPTLQAGKRIRVRTAEDKNLGDLIISAEYVQKEAQKYGISFEERLQILLVHGICHLLGYDHIEDADYRRMRAKEAWLLKILKLSAAGYKA